MVLNGLGVSHNQGAHDDKEEVKRCQPLPGVIGEPIPGISEPEVELFVSHG